MVFACTDGAITGNLGHETNGRVLLGVPAQPPSVTLARWELDGRVVDDEPKRRHGSMSARREAAGSRRLPHPSTAMQRCLGNQWLFAANQGRRAVSLLIHGILDMPMSGPSRSCR